MISFAIAADTPPMTQDQYGAVRVGKSRVLLELVIRAFQDGATPEAIVLRYPTLGLPDVYSTIAYYLNHPSEVERYIADRESVSAEVHALIVSGQRDLTEIRNRILAQSRD